MAKLRCGKFDYMEPISFLARDTPEWTAKKLTVVFIQPGVQEMSIIICASKVSVDQY